MNINCEKIISDILKTSSALNSEQQERVMNLLDTDGGLSYQEIAHFLAPQINAKVDDIYMFLLTRDKDNRRDNDYNKTK